MQEEEGFNPLKTQIAESQSCSHGSLPAVSYNKLLDTTPKTIYQCALVPGKIKNKNQSGSALPLCRAKQGYHRIPCLGKPGQVLSWVLARGS